MEWIRSKQLAMKYTFVCPWTSQRSIFPHVAKVARNCFLIKTVLPVGGKYHYSFRLIPPWMDYFSTIQKWLWRGMAPESRVVNKRLHTCCSGNQRSVNTRLVFAPSCSRWLPIARHRLSRNYHGIYSYTLHILPLTYSGTSIARGIFENGNVHRRSSKNICNFCPLAFCTTHIVEFSP